MGKPGIWPLTKTTLADAGDHKVPRLAAALSYYTLLSLSPLLIVAIAVSGLVFGAEAARGQIARELQQLFGPEAGDAIQSLVAHANKPSTGVLGTIVGV